jgi:hypothetical protein
MNSYSRRPAEDPPTSSSISQEVALMARFEQVRPYLWQGKVGPAFWSVAGVFSLVLNMILIILLVLVGRELFGLKGMVEEQLVNGLYSNFVLMDQAVIATTVEVEDTIPVQFALPVQTDTIVVLTEDTFLENATVNLRTGGLSIVNAPTDIVLLAGTELPVKLDILVPVNTTVPVNLEVAVEIPLQDTELHTPFVGLQNVVSPYDSLLASLPDSWAEALCASSSGSLCRWLTR